MKLTEYIKWLERMIQGCDDSGGMEREKAVYQNCLKKARQIGQKLPIQNVIGRLSLNDLEVNQYSITIPKITDRNIDEEKENEIYNKLINKITEIEWVNVSNTGQLEISFRNMQITDKQIQIVIDVLNDL